MVALSLVPTKGNGARYFPYQGFLGLTEIKIDGGTYPIPLSDPSFCLTIAPSGAYKDRGRKGLTGKNNYRQRPLLRVTARPGSLHTHKHSCRLHTGPLDETRRAGVRGRGGCRSSVPNNYSIKSGRSQHRQLSGLPHMVEG